MFVRGLLRSPEDDGAGGGGAEPPPRQVQQQPPPAPPAPQSSGSRQQDTVADLRAEAAARRIANRELQEKLDDAERRALDAASRLEAAKTSATAPLQARLERANQRLIDATLQSAMVSAGLQDPDLVVLAMRMPNAPKVTVDDEFEVQGAAEMVEAFKKWKPEFFKKAALAADPPAPGRQPAPKPAPASTSGGAEPPPSGGSATVDVRNMDKKTYAAYKAKTLSDMRRAGAGSAGFGR